MIKAKTGSLKVLVTALAVIALVGISCARAAEPTATPRPAATPAPTYTPIPTFTPVPGAPTPALAPVATPTLAPAATPIAPPALARPTEWTVVIADDPAEGDPLTEYGSNIGGGIMTHVMDNLIWLRDPTGGTNVQPHPNLAESWEFPGEKSMVVHLRKGVKFHNGEELTAEHAVWFYDAVIAADPPIRRKNSLAPFGKASVVDKYSFRWDMPKPYARAITSINGLKLVPFVRKGISGAEFGKKPLGAGPYKVVQWERDQPVILEAYDGYWRGKPAFPPRLVFRQIPEPATRLAVLLTGQGHIAEKVPLSDLYRLRDNPKTEIVTLKDFGRLLYHINLYRPLWRDRDVRLALNYAVDKQLIVEAILEGLGSPSPAGAMLPGELGYTPDMKPYPYDPAKARELLEKAGYSQGFTFDWMITQGVFQKDFEIAEAAANMMAKVGIKAGLRATERARLLRDRNEGKFDVVELTWPWSWERGSLFNYALNVVHTDKNNIPIHGAPPSVLVQLRELWAQAEQTLDTEKRKSLMERLNKLSAEEAIYLNIHTNDEMWGILKVTRWRHSGLGTGGDSSPFWDFYEMMGETPPK